jgi:ACS family hexuronate transporter-like MFS transporter
VVLGVSHWGGWRGAFVFVGALGLVWLVAWLCGTRSPDLAHVWRDPTDKSATARGNTAAAYRQILTTTQFWRVFAVSMLVNPCLYFSLNWLPTYFVQERGLSVGSQLRWILTMIYVGLDLGYLASGTAVLGLARRGWPVQKARMMVFLSATGLLALAAAVPFVGDLDTAVTVLLLVNFGVGVWIAMYLTMAQEVSSAHVATAAGLLGGSGSLAGAVAMWAVGWVTHTTASFVAPMAAVAVAALGAAAAGLSVSRHAGREPALNTS